jgi:hypothetical protein
MEEKDPMLKQVRAKANDKDHEILYKSPGQHRGSKYKGKVRTYDFQQATTKEEAANLIADGWSVSEEEAYELADALEAGEESGSKRPKKRKAAPEPEEEEEETEEGEEEEEEEEEDPILAEPKKKPVPGLETKKKKKAKK